MVQHADETPSQRNIVREALLKRMETWEIHATSPAETSLAHLLLAQMFALDGQDASALLHLNTKWNTTVGCGFINTSFHVLAYLYHKSNESKPLLQPLDRGRHIHESTGWDAFTRNRPNNVQLASVNHNDFVCFALGRPRYSTLQLQSATSDRPDPSTPVSEYVQSCLDWCITSINDTLPGVTVSLLYWNSSPSAETTLSDTLTVYKYLHKQLRREWRGDSKKPTTGWKWMQNTREALGISTVELLIFCCDMVMHDSRPQPFHDYYMYSY